MGERPRIPDPVDRAYHPEPWHGPALLATLAGVTAAQAAMHPTRGAHSIWVGRARGELERE